ncbi:RHS repeat protein [Xanthomonas campestris pv. phormiicola]|nr:RHS repeat protein [Xanthomonas campestris pv. phormiicola]UYC17606.1 RHS repeat protein [Xanthomonas campestris pv. phormiicola]
MNLRVWVVFFLNFPCWSYAQSPQSQYCFKGQCFSTLNEAESVMRASASPYGKYIRRSNVIQAGDAGKLSLKIEYEIPDQAPQEIIEPYYGTGLDAESCPIGDSWKAGEIKNETCHSESLVMQAALNHMSSVTGCSYFDGELRGSYYLYGSKDNRNGRIEGGDNAGVLDYAGSRVIYYKNRCPNWTEASTASFPIQKYQVYYCPDGFIAANASGANITMPYLCKVKNSLSLSVEVKNPDQTPSCAVNSNPCFPATGEKARFEEDFYFAGRPYIRSYHSKGLVQSGDWGGTGWMHSYSDSLSTVAGMALISEDGYIKKFLQTGADYRGQKNYGDLIRKNGSGYVLMRKDGMRRFYGEDGKLTAVIVGSPATSITLTYVGSLIDRVTDGLGRSLRYSYAEGKLARIDLPDGKAVDYAYDTQGNLVSVHRSDGSVRRYVYNESDSAPSGSSNLMTGIEDDGVRYATFKYDKSWRPILSTLHAGDQSVEMVTIDYIGDTSAHVNDVNGAEHQYQWSAGPFKDITSDVVVGGGYQRIFDSNGRLLKMIDGKGYEVRFTYQDDISGGQVSTRENSSVVRNEVYDVNNLPGEISVFSGVGEVLALTRFSYDANGRMSFRCIYDDGGSAYACGSQSVAPIGIRQWRFVRCGDAESSCPLSGLLLSIKGPRTEASDVVTFSYYAGDNVDCQADASLCRYRKGDLWKVTNALGQVTEYLSYDGAGRVLSVKDANGTITDYTYHPRGWLTASKVRGADDTSENDDRITLIDYWPTGLVKQVTQPDGAFTAFTYDAAHRLTDIADNAGNTLHYTLDNAGNRVKEDTKDAAGTLKRTLSRVYNQLGQLATQATASGDPTDFGYDANGNTTAVTDALGHKTQNDYDPLNRLARTLQDVGGIAAETKFGYDALDNLTKVTDPKGLDITYAYNGLGDLTKLTSPDTGVTTYAYDSAGNRATQTDARNIKTTYSYDALNRLTKVAYPTSSLNVSYTYDVSQTTCASGETYAVGRLARMQDGSGSTDYCYDRFGDLVRKVQTTNGKVFVLRYAYTKAGQLSRLTYPDGAAVDYVRNAQGQTTEVGVTPAGGTRQVLLGNATYYPFGPVANWSYGNGRPMQRVLDQDYRPLAINDTRTDGLSTGFAFDPAGNLSVLTAAGNTAPVVSLDYDALGRLTAFKDGPTGTVIDGYSYDATGNRLSAKVNTVTQSYTYPTTNHRLSAVAGTARTYDAIGNTLSIGGTAQEFAYDATGRMSQAKRAGTVVMKYGYNGRGEQVRRVDKTNTYTLYDESGHWLGNYDANGATLQQAIWLDDLPVGVLAKNSVRYVQPDHLGTPRAVIDPVRDVAIWTWDLKGEAFGNTPPDQDPDKDGTAFVFDMRFPGQRYDAATGLNQNYFRDYDPATGRYGQSDPIGLNGGLNTYGYSLQAPVDHSDAWGLATWKGNSYGVGGGAGRYGGFIDFYQLTSPCPDGGLAYVYIMALGGAGGVGYPVSMTGSSVELSDANGVPDPNVFNGPYAKFSVGSVSFGPGYQLYQRITIGGAWMSLDTGAKGSGWHQSQGGFDGSLYSVGVGKAIVLEKKECNKCGGK